MKSKMEFHRHHTSEKTILLLVAQDVSSTRHKDCSPSRSTTEQSVASRRSLHNYADPRPDVG